MGGKSVRHRIMFRCASSCLVSPRGKKTTVAISCPLFESHLLPNIFRFVLSLFSNYLTLPSVEAFKSQCRRRRSHFDTKRVNASTTVMAIDLVKQISSFSDGRGSVHLTPHPSRIARAIVCPVKRHRGLPTYDCSVLHVHSIWYCAPISLD